MTAMSSRTGTGRGSGTPRFLPTAACAGTGSLQRPLFTPALRGGLCPVSDLCVHPLTPIIYTQTQAPAFQPAWPRDSMHPSGSTCPQQGGHRGRLAITPRVCHVQPPFPVTRTQGEAVATAGPPCALSMDSDARPPRPLLPTQPAVQLSLRRTVVTPGVLPPFSLFLPLRHLCVWTDAETESNGRASVLGPSSTAPGSNVSVSMGTVWIKQGNLLKAPGKVPDWSGGSANVIPRDTI